MITSQEGKARPFGRFFRKLLRKRCDQVGLLATMRRGESRLALLISRQRASAMAEDPLSWQTPKEEKREL